MRNHLLFIIGALCLSFVGTTIDPFEIKIGKGIGPFDIGHSSRTSVERLLGNGRLSNRDQSLILSYPEKGLSFEFLSADASAVIKRIRIAPPSQSKTFQSIGIGSSKKFIEQTLGPPAIIEQDTSHLTKGYYRMHYSEVVFELYPSNSSGNTNVQSITLLKK